jgi:mono/diheme cytochrome c family protein
MKHAITFLIVTLWYQGAPPLAYSGEIPPSVKRIFAAHCLHCHDDSAKKGRLSLESLKPDFGQPAWVRVHDKLARGQMPPAGEDRPEPAEIKQVTDWLSQQ